ncbi:MAG: ribonuclease HIII [Candidatus Fermentibacteraceae bacterium]|nr:ribonuclease HIII [Candidatus Fermentibacteraceae bacterium]
MIEGDRLSEYVRGVLDGLASRGIDALGTRELSNGTRVEFGDGSTSCSMNFYCSRKKGFSCIPSGGDAGLAERILVLMSPKPAERTGEGDPAPSSAAARIGSDEAGKGDYMGPLTAAAIMVDHRLSRELRLAGVRDSKALADRPLTGIAEAVRSMASGLYAVVSLPPPDYNRKLDQLNREGKNSLDLLAECHASAISRLVSGGAVPDRIIIDRFCGEKRIAHLLPEGGYRLELRERGESDTAVAAASILARDAYMKGLERLSAEYGIRAVPGSGRTTDSVVRKYVDRYGSDILYKVAKVHFRNTSRILSLF